MTKITNSNQYHKSYRKNKSKNGHTRTSEYIRGGIRCHGGASIPCWPVTPVVSPISTLDKQYNPIDNVHCQKKRLYIWIWRLYHLSTSIQKLWPRLKPDYVSVHLTMVVNSLSSSHFHISFLKVIQKVRFFTVSIRWFSL
jgi:hypothetical protein